MPQSWALRAEWDVVADINIVDCVPKDLSGSLLQDSLSTTVRPAMSKASVDKTSCTCLPLLLPRATQYSRDLSHGTYADESIEMPTSK